MSGNRRPRRGRGGVGRQMSSDFYNTNDSVYQGQAAQGQFRSYGHPGWRRGMSRGRGGQTGYRGDGGYMRSQLLMEQQQQKKQQKLLMMKIKKELLEQQQEQLYMQQQQLMEQQKKMTRSGRRRRKQRWQNQGESSGLTVNIPNPLALPQSDVAVVFPRRKKRPFRSAHPTPLPSSVEVVVDDSENTMSRDEGFGSASSSQTNSSVDIILDDEMLNTFHTPEQTDMSTSQRFTRTVEVVYAE